MVNLSNEYLFGDYTLGKLFTIVVQTAFSIAAVIVVFYFAIGAIRIITSGGNKEIVAEARKMITTGIFGIILMVIVFLIALFIPEFLGLTGFNFN